VDSQTTNNHNGSHKFKFGLNLDVDRLAMRNEIKNGLSTA